MNPFPTNYKDLSTNLYLNCTSKLRYMLDIVDEGPFKVPDNYKQVFSDNFRISKLSNWEDGSTWWGQPYHPGNMIQWYDLYQTIVSPYGVELHSTRKPRHFAEIDTIIPNATGIIRTKQSWRFGIFKFVAKLPKGTYLWPALWLTGDSSWPPEIDILEGYSDNSTDYKKGKILQSNVHSKYGIMDFHIGGKNHYLPNKVTEEFIEYSLWWEKDFIRIYYNGYLVRQITDPKLLETILGKQKIVLNNAVQKGFNKTNETPLIVSEVEVYQLVD